MNMLHMLTQFVAATLFALGAMYLVYLYYRQQMPSGMAAAKSTKSLLKLEQTQYLEPKKAVHILRVGTERFLLASTDQGLQLLSSLKGLTEAQVAEEEAIEREHSIQNPPSVFTRNGLSQRLALSLRMTLADRFGARTK